MNKLVFLHIPKTGGTSLRLELEKSFKVYNYYYEKLIINNNKDIKINDDYQIVAGHRQFIFLNKYFSIEKNIYLTILRNPIERYISHFNHYKHESKIDSFDNFLKKRKFDNLQVKMLSNMKSPSLEQAFENLEKFKIIGLNENYNELLNNLKTHFPEFKFNNLRKNVSIEKNKNALLIDQVDKETLSKIKELNQLDIELYEKIKTSKRK